MHAGVYCCYSVSAHSEGGGGDRHAHQQWEQDLVACHSRNWCYYRVDDRHWTGFSFLWRKKGKVINFLCIYTDMLPPCLNLCIIIQLLLINFSCVVRTLYFSLRVTVSGKKKLRQSTMHGITKETSLGPVVAQSHLRDMARPPTSIPPTAAEPDNAGGVGNAGERPRSVSGEALLEFQDLTDYNKYKKSSESLNVHLCSNNYYFNCPFYSQAVGLHEYLVYWCSFDPMFPPNCSRADSPQPLPPYVYPNISYSHFTRPTT